MKIPAADLVPRVTVFISEKWQQFWNSCTGNQLQAIRPTVGTMVRSTTVKYTAPKYHGINAMALIPWY